MSEYDARVDEIPNLAGSFCIVGPRFRRRLEHLSWKRIELFGLVMVELSLLKSHCAGPPRTLECGVRGILEHSCYCLFMITIDFIVECYLISVRLKNLINLFVEVLGNLQTKFIWKWKRSSDRFIHSLVFFLLLGNSESCPSVEFWVFALFFAQPSLWPWCFGVRLVKLL